MKRIKIEYGIENKMNGKYKIFTILPSFILVHDSQFKEGYGKGEEGSMEYSIFIDWLAWSFNVKLDIKNKE